MVIEIMCMTVSAGLVIGGTIKGVFFMKNRKEKLLENLGILRDKIYVLSKTNEEARMVLQKSKGRKIKDEKSIVNEIRILNEALENILEHKRKESLMELENVREQLNILAISSAIAKKELAKSFTARITTEKVALKEIDRLLKVIYVIDESNKKELMDKLVSTREQLQILETDRAIIVLNESYAKKNMSCKEVKQEILRLQSELKSIQLEDKKRCMQELKEIRDKLYRLSLECELAKDELSNSYQRKLITIDDINNEIDELSIAYIDCIEASRRDKLNRINEIREEVYENSRDSQYARMKLENSFNKLFSDEIMVKEINALEETIDKVYRDNELKSYKRDGELFL